MILSLPFMFCPQCQAEYRPHIHRCSDCDVALVEHLTKSDRDSDGELSDINLRDVWSGENQNDCVVTCEQLRNAGIPYKVIQHKKQFLKGVDEHYEISVPSEFYDPAKKLANSDRVDFSDEPADQAIMEIPANVRKPDTTELAKDWNRHKGDFENATVELQFRNEPEYASMIESSLQENYINYRVDVLDNGSRKI